jgi:PIN domain nuclease of toxin-antitoxin system
MTRVLVDTHVALWALGTPERLTAHERGVMVDPSIERVMSPLSVWEAAIKREAGRLLAPRDLARTFAVEFRMLTLDSSLLERAAQLPRHHGDPFDRGLIAHALQDDLVVLTRDNQFEPYGVRLSRER